MTKRVIICVDDEKIVLRSLKRELNDILGNDEYIIETAEGGEDALEVFEEVRQDGYEVPLIISDHIMPDMKGDELLERIHKIAPDTLKIMLTGQADIEGVTNAVNRANLYRYIAKPWEKADLSLTVREAVRSYFQDRKLEEQNQALHAMNQELEQFNATLEQQVRERTAELEAQQVELKQKNEQLYELNASKDKFFSIISHDLRSPFNTLLGFAQLLEENLAEYSAEQIRRNVNRLRTSAERLYALLENLLTWSRIQRGIMDYHPELIDLHDIAVDNIELFTPNAEQKNISLHSVVAEQSMVYADYSMINTVVRNLTSNALKFTPGGGSVRLLADLNEHEMEIAVSDTGVGIPEDILPRIMRIDTQYTHTGTAGEKGTGLGLILCRELVERNKGRIWIESQLGVGTTFRFTLPIESS